MKKLLNSLFISLFLVLISSANAFAVTCSSLGASILPPPSDIVTGTVTDPQFTLTGVDKPQDYTVHLYTNDMYNGNPSTYTPDSNGDFTLNQPYAYTWSGGDSILTHRRILKLSGPNISGECDLGSYSVNPNPKDNSCKAVISYKNIDNPSCVGTNENFSLKISDFKINAQPYSGQAFLVVRPGFSVNHDPITITNGTSTKDMGAYTNAGTYEVKVSVNNTFYCTTSFTIPVKTCDPVPILTDDLGSGAPGIFNMCQSVSSADYGECEKCLSVGVWTAFGCLHTDPSELIKQILTISLSIAGGVALITMLFGALRIITSSGDPKGVEEGQEIITNAIIGLLVIIFSVFLLKLIGVDILQLPGL